LELRDDCRPLSQHNASGRYAEPALLDWLDNPVQPWLSRPQRRSGRARASPLRRVSIP